MTIKATRVVGLRDDVARFAVMMETVLREHDHKGGWSGCSMGYLKRRLGQELKELRAALDAGSALDIEREAADVANFAMMIATTASHHVAERLSQPKKKKR